MITRTDPAGTASFSWTPRGELYAVGEPATGKTIIHTYNDASQLTGINFDNNLPAAPTRTLTYDTVGRVATDGYKNAGGTTTSSIAYYYDLNNNLTLKVTGPAGVAGAGKSRYFYDRADRLVNWRKFDGTSIGYVYDNNGNRTMNGSTASSYDQRNRILSNGPTSYTWAPRGVLATSVTGTTTTTYTFDTFGQMTSSGAVGFAYDALGRTSSRTVGTTTTGFSYSGAGGDPTSDGSNIYTRTPGGGVLAVAQGAIRLLTQTDGHGDVTATLTTAGAVSSSRAYDPYGVVAATNGTTSPSIGYQGDYTDPTSGLVDMGARWYQPASGSFTSRDTFSGRLDSPVSLNRYTYANNNPIGLFDPDGREPGSWITTTNKPTPAPPPQSPGGKEGPSKPIHPPDPSEDARDRATAKAIDINAIRNACIARGDQCKTDYNNLTAFAQQAATLAIQKGGYIAASQPYLPAPPPPPPMPGLVCGNSCIPTWTPPTATFQTPGFIGPPAPGTITDPANWCLVGQHIGANGPSAAPPASGQYDDEGTVRAIIAYVVSDQGNPSSAIIENRHGVGVLVGGW